MPGQLKHRRMWSYGSNTVVSTIIAFAIIVFLILIAERHPYRLDLTETGKYTLSEQTRNIVKAVQEPVVIKAFFQTGAEQRTGARDLLETLQYTNSLISYEVIDPDRQPEVARRYEIRAYGTLVLEGYGKKQTAPRADEESIANALFKITRGQEKKIYFTTGHGEHSLKDTGKDGYSALQAVLAKDNYQLADLNLFQQAEVPEDASLVIIAGPEKPFFPSEIDSLRKYLEGGGKLLVLLDPYRDVGFRDLLKNYGIELHDDIVIDKLSRVFGGSFTMPVVTEYGSHKITEGFNIATFYPEARSVRPATEAPDGVQVKSLASTSSEAWAETNQEMIRQGQAAFDAQTDFPGPVPLVVLAEVDTNQKPQEAKGPSDPADSGQAPAVADNPRGAKKACLVVAGNSRFVDNTHFELSGNGDFFLNMANYLAEEETLIVVERRDKKGQPLILTHGQARMLFWVSMVAVPLLILCAGFTVYRVRRSQR
jgi:ABC-type uncharacterized transport system involved in gliding motility auxiliary subunit